MFHDYLKGTLIPMYSQKYYQNQQFQVIDNKMSVRQLEELANDLNLSSKELAAGNGVIPKYRAIYLDSLKKDKIQMLKDITIFDEMYEKNLEYFKEIYSILILKFE